MKNTSQKLETANMKPKNNARIIELEIESLPKILVSYQDVHQFMHSINKIKNNISLTSKKINNSINNKKIIEILTILNSKIINKEKQIIKTIVTKKYYQSDDFFKLYNGEASIQHLLNKYPDKMKIICIEIIRDLDRSKHTDQFEIIDFSSTLQQKKIHAAINDSDSDTSYSITGQGFETFEAYD